MSSPKLPWMRFECGAWLRDRQVRELSDATKAIWIDLLCILHESAPDTGSLARPLDRWSAALGRTRSAVLKALRELQEVGTADIAPHLSDAAAPVEASTVVTIASRRMARDAGMREKWRETKVGQRGGHRRGHEPVVQHGVQAGVHRVVSPVSSECPGADRQKDRETEKNPPGSLTDALASLGCLAPGDSAAASPPEPTMWPEIHPSLKPFERWWTAGVVKRLVAAQRAFVEGFPARLAEIRAAYPGLDVDDQLRRAYAWEGANPWSAKTPRGRAAFLFRWCSTAQDRGLRGAPAGVNGHAEQSASSRAEQAFASIRARAQAVFNGRDDGRIADAIAAELFAQLGGFSRMGGMDQFGIAGLRKDFVAGYVSRVSQPMTGSPGAAAA